MKKIIITFCFTLLLVKLSAQNTFPTSGNVGIGVPNPDKPLVVQQQTDGAGIMLLSPTTNSDPDNHSVPGEYLHMGTNPSYHWIYTISSNTRLDLSGGQQMFLFADNISFEGNVVLSRLGDPDERSPTPIATQKGSHVMPFQCNIWNGMHGEFRYNGFQTIASTTIQGAHRLALRVNSTNSGLTDGLEPLSLFSDGTVGVNTLDTKGYQLAVGGPAIFTRAVVKQQSNWPDYVFHKGYKLPSLQEIEKYIAANHHLQDVPSAQEVEKNGIDLGENQAVLLKKVEELTLYLIEQNKRLESQQKEIDLLKKQLLLK